MTSHTLRPCDLSDGDLLAELERAVGCERRATAHLIALIVEVDSRKLYAQQGCSSLFTFCVQVLHLSEHAAYLRIQAARCARRFPAVLDRLSDGSLHLSAVSLLGPQLTEANHLELLDLAKHKSKRDVERLIARLRPQPDVPALVRKLPSHAAPLMAEPRVAEPSSDVVSSAMTVVAPAPASPRPVVIKPLAPERYKVQFTVTHDTHEKLRRVQDLMRHIVPNGDLAAIFDRALTLLLAELSKAKCSATEHPKRAHPTGPRSRHIPATIKRDIWRRDEGRCAFQGDKGRCGETGFLEFHHVVPYAYGGETSVSNIELRCRTHNNYEAERWSGALWAKQVRETRADFSA
jgi:5-methylcytosine-specific restriction endonuclease McrA